MADKLLKITQVAERLGTTAGVARNILEDNGLKAVDLGKGRGRGLRWSERAVDGLVEYLVDIAQGKKFCQANPSLSDKETQTPNLASMDIDDLFALTQCDA